MASKLSSKRLLINSNLLEVDSEIEDLYCPVDDDLITQDRVDLRSIDLVEDEIWGPNEVPPLEDLAMSAFGEAFETYWFRIALTPPQVMARLGHYIPTNVDVLKAALVIEDNCAYWKRRTEDTWPYECHDIYAINNGWKEYFLQKYYGEYIQELDPYSVEYEEEAKVAIIFSEYVKNLAIDGLRINSSDEMKVCSAKKLPTKLVLSHGM
ncbi:uncharacterized protein isoform X4 [Rhodnius prolixus]|uniref:uncharacterized protein isoform X4 n=1 Tax=Rhodnius prolixus TaxID=13249 RepID=UPI003D18E1F4